MKKFIALVFVVATGLISFAQELDRSKAPTPQPNPEINIEIPDVITLDNGLQVIVVDVFNFSCMQTIRR